MPWLKAVSEVMQLVRIHFLLPFLLFCDYLFNVFLETQFKTTLHILFLFVMTFYETLSVHYNGILTAISVVEALVVQVISSIFKVEVIDIEVEAIIYICIF